MLSTSFRKSFLLGAYTEEVKFANFCHDQMQNHWNCPISHYSTKKILFVSVRPYVVMFFVKSQIFSPFPEVNMNGMQKSVD